MSEIDEGLIRQWLSFGAMQVFRKDWELEGRDAPHVDHVTDDLAAFLGRIGTS
jgi:hypothetical protein